MGLQELMLLAMLIFYFCSPASFALVSNNLIPENTHKNMGYSRIDENNNVFGSGGTIVSGSKYTTVLEGGGGGGRSGGDDNGKSGQSNNSPQGGGNGVVPVYAAGVANYNKNHKGDAITCTLCLKERFAVLITTTVYLLSYIAM